MESVRGIEPPLSQHIWRVPSLFCCILKYLVYVPITLSLSLVAVVIAYLVAEMSSFSNQSSTQMLIRTKGVAERGSRTKGRRGGVRPKAKKKIVTPPILIVEVVVDVPKEYWMVLL